MRASKARSLSIKCWACSRVTPKAFIHGHHKIPQAAGGTDKDIVQVCADCHTSLHATANILRNPKRQGELPEVINHLNKSPNHAKQVLELAKLVNKYMTLKADGFLDIKDLKFVSFEMDDRIHQGLMLLARDRKLSIANYCKSIMEKKVFEEYPLLKKGR